MKEITARDKNLDKNRIIGWHDIPSKMFDAKNDSVASYATISPFEGTLNIICVAQNDAGSSHRLGSPLELSHRLQEAHIAYSSLLLM